MQVIGNVVIYILMACMMAGCVGAILRPDRGIGLEFCEGLKQLSTIFIPVAGVMSALPYLGALIRTVFSHLSSVMGNDPAMWAGIILPPDMGGNILIHDMASGNEVWMIALFTSFILGSGVTFGIPMSISMVAKKDHKYMAMGILCGLMACPVGITVSCILTIPGNLMGIAVVCNTLLGWSTGTVNLVLSIPTIALGTMILGRRMLAYTAVTMVGMSVMTDLFTELVPNLPSGSILLYTLLAGCVMGTGCGLILYVGGTTGGTTILGRLLVRKTPRISLGLWLTVMDVCIMMGGAAALHDIRSLLYSVIFEIVCCKAIDVTLVLLKNVLTPRW